MELKYAGYGDKLKDGPDMEYHGRLHAHDKNDYELHAFTEGRGSIEIDKIRYPIEPGAVFLVRPGEFHSILPGEVESPLGYYVFIFDPESHSVNDSLLLDMLKDKHNRLTQLSPRDYVLVQEIHDLFYSRALYDRIAVSCFFTGLLYHWYGSSVIKDTVDLKAGERNINRMHVEKAIYYLKRHLDESINIKDLAQSLRLTPEHLSRIFRKEMGVTPHQYMTRLKMEEAMFRLIKTNDTLEHIAVDLGFSDSFHFSHVFTKFAGCSPGKYRQGNSPVDHYQPKTEEIGA
jgi:AraC-like DNA-binding protein